MNDPLNPFAAFFSPRSVAVVGATEAAGSVGRAVLENLATFEGRVFPVNPKRAVVLGRPAYTSLAALPEAADLAVIVTPAATVPGLIRDCAETGIRNAIIISAGFKETGPGGHALEEAVLAEARRSELKADRSVPAGRAPWRSTFQDCRPPQGRFMVVPEQN